MAKAAPPTASEVTKRLSSPSISTMTSPLLSGPYPPPVAVVSKTSPKSPPNIEQTISLDSHLRSISELSLSSISSITSSNHANQSISAVLPLSGGLSGPAAAPTVPPVPTGLSSGTEQLQKSTTPGEKTYMSGYLLKKNSTPSPTGKKWKKRWFVLRSDGLAVYKNDKEYKLLRIVPLPEIHSVSPCTLNSKSKTKSPSKVSKSLGGAAAGTNECGDEWHTDTFAIITSSRNYYLKAESEKEMRSWHDGIELATKASTPGANSGPARVLAQDNVSQFISEPEDESEDGDDTPTVAVFSSKSLPIAQRSSSPRSTHNQLSISVSSSATSRSSESHSSSNVLGLSLSPASPTSPASATSFNFSSESYFPGPVQCMPASFSTPLHQGLPEDSLSNPESVATQIANMSVLSSSEDEEEDEIATAEWDARKRGSASTLVASSVSPMTRLEPQTLGSNTNVHFNDATIGRRNAPKKRPTMMGPIQKDPNKVLVQGYLMKQGKRKTWRKRWFMLTETKLSYSKSHMETKVNREIPISSILDVLEFTAEEKSGHSSEQAAQEHCFKIVTPKRTYLVTAPGEEDEIRWLAGLQWLVGERRRRGSISAVSNASSSTIPPV